MDDKFWRNVDRSGGPDACWPWLLSRDKKYGYGTAAGGSAHRLAYELANGPIPPGKVVRHTCDHPPCCNPRHLLLGTHADNVADKVARGRQAKGETNGRAILTADDVVLIRWRATFGENLTALAREYGVTRRAVQYIVERINWKHVA